MDTFHSHGNVFAIEKDIRTMKRQRKKSKISDVCFGQNKQTKIKWIKEQIEVLKSKGTNIKGTQNECGQVPEAVAGTNRRCLSVCLSLEGSTTGSACREVSDYWEKAPSAMRAKKITNYEKSPYSNCLTIQRNLLLPQKYLRRKLKFVEPQLKTVDTYFHYTCVLWRASRRPFWEQVLPVLIFFINIFVLSKKKKRKDYAQDCSRCLCISGNDSPMLM